VKVVRFERRIDVRLRLRSCGVRGSYTRSPRVVTTAELARRGGRRRDSWLSTQNAWTQRGDYNECQVPGRQK
jgi:hypothetical protein